MRSNGSKQNKKQQTIADMPVLILYMLTPITNGERGSAGVREAGSAGSRERGNAGTGERKLRQVLRFARRSLAQVSEGEIVAPLTAG